MGYHHKLLRLTSKYRKVCRKMSIPSKTISVDISIEAHKYIAEIVKRTGETKVKLFERIIQSEYKRIMNNENKQVKDYGYIYIDI